MGHPPTRWHSRGRYFDFNHPAHGIERTQHSARRCCQPGKARHDYRGQSELWRGNGSAFNAGGARFARPRTGPRSLAGGEDAFVPFDAGVRLKHLLPAVVVPALRNVREGRGTRSF